MKQKDQTIKIQAAVADFYETHGANFAQTRGRGWGVMKLVQEAVTSGMTLVDVGAGNGRLADAIPSDVQYIGIEPSSTLRAASTDRLTTRGNAEMRAGGFPNLLVADAVADVTSCFAVLHHIPTRNAQRAAIAELARITKSGGIAVVTAWNLRGRRMKAWKTWLAAWLRLPMLKGGECGDVWIPWTSNGTSGQRFVHAFTLGEFKNLFSKKDWHIERAEYWAEDVSTKSALDARNLVIVAKRKNPPLRIRGGWGSYFFKTLLFSL